MIHDNLVEGKMWNAIREADDPFAFVEENGGFSGLKEKISSQLEEEIISRRRKAVRTKTKKRKQKQLSRRRNR